MSISYTRSERLRMWMRQHGISIAALSRQARVTYATARNWIDRETIPTNRHEQLLGLGFPKELLPLPMDLATGRPPLAPDFPGLRKKKNLEEQA